MEKRDSFIKAGRPRLEVDYALVLRLRDEEHLGWSLGAEEYRRRSGRWISRDTFKRRYYEAKDMARSQSIIINKPEVIIKSPLEKFFEEWEQKLKKL